MWSKAIMIATVLVLMPAVVIASFIDVEPNYDHDSWKTAEVPRAKENSSDKDVWDHGRFSYFFGPENDESTKLNDHMINGDLLSTSNTSSPLTNKEEMATMTTPYPHNSGNHRHLRHRKSDNESSILHPGIFQVLDSAAPRSGHKHAPSCILAQMRASFVIPMISRRNGSSELFVKNKTIVIPPTSHVSGSCGEDQQTITLMWNNTIDSGALVKTGKLTLMFTKVEKENAIFLSQVWADVALFLESGDTPIGVPADTASEASQNLIMSLTQTEMWRTPLRFAYFCHNRMEVKLHANTMPIQAGGSDSIVDPVSNAEAFLVFHELRVETFLKGRFTRHFTHLAYDCRDKWAYNYMPAVVGSTLGATCLGIIVAFFFRKHLGCGGEETLGDDQKEQLVVDPEVQGEHDPQDADDETSSPEN